eukprot:1156861-Pelagomonas_calceolata.AAC.7
MLETASLSMAQFKHCACRHVARPLFGPGNFLAQLAFLHLIPYNFGIGTYTSYLCDANALFASYVHRLVKWQKQHPASILINTPLPAGVLSTPAASDYIAILRHNLLGGPPLYAALSNVPVFQGKPVALDRYRFHPQPHCLVTLLRVVHDLLIATDLLRENVKRKSYGMCVWNWPMPHMRQACPPLLDSSVSCQGTICSSNRPDGLHHGEAGRAAGAAAPAALGCRGGTGRKIRWGMIAGWMLNALMQDKVQLKRGSETQGQH